MINHQKTIITKQLRCIMLIIALVISILAFPTNAMAENLDYKSILQPYAKELLSFNQTHGTNYQFKLMEESENEEKELAKFLGNMTMEEFREYLLDAYNNDISSQQTANTIAPKYSENALMSTVSPRSAYSARQHFYYGKGTNCLYIIASVYSPAGIAHHQYASIKEVGHGVDTSNLYPQLIPSDYSYEISSNGYYVDVFYTCTHYVSENLAYANDQLVPVRFEAGGGDIYAEQEI